MISRSISHHFALALCALAWLVAQTFGGKVDYYCLCGGQPVPTAVSHCYGPHSEICAEVEAQAGASTGGQGDGDRRDHQAVKEEVHSRPVEAAQQVIAPQVLLATLPLVEVFCASEGTKVPASDSVDFGGSPPFGVTVARTIVLRI